MPYGAQVKKLDEVFLDDGLKLWVDPEGKFLQERLGQAWETEGLAAINQWIEGNGKQVELVR